jgi:predicted RNA binding protein YcfA (HicA-like mRNA interferase family)
MTDRLPSLKPKQIIRALQRAGFAIARTSGSHCRLVHRSDAARKVTVPIHNEDLKRGTLRATIAQAGLGVHQFIALLWLDWKLI